MLPGVMWIASGTLRPGYDCYVIGSGPAGITLALELAKANKKVLLFESGTATDARADMPNAINQGRNMSTTLGHSRAAFSEPRLWWGETREVGAIDVNIDQDLVA